MFLFLYIAFRSVDIGAVLEYITGISILWLIPFMFVFMLSHLLRAMRWKVMITSVKPNASILNLFTSTMIGYGVNCVVPRLGEVYRGLFLGKLENLSRSSMFGTIIVERVIDILSLGFSVLISVWIYSGNLYSEFPWLKSALIIGFIAMGIATVFLILVVRMQEKFYNIILKFAGKISKRIAEKLAYIFQMLTEGFGTIKTVSVLAQTVFYSIVIMVVYGLTSYLGFYLLKMNEVQDITFGMAWILMTISAFGIIIPTPGGTGSYHLINISVLMNLFNFTQRVSSAYALLTHFISYVFFIISPFILMYFVNSKRKKEGKPVVNFFNVLRSKIGEE